VWWADAFCACLFRFNFYVQFALPCELRESSIHKCMYALPSTLVASLVTGLEDKIVGMFDADVRMLTAQVMTRGCNMGLQSWINT